jgi:hypothetical protein
MGYALDQSAILIARLPHAPLARPSRRNPARGISPFLRKSARALAKQLEVPVNRLINIICGARDVSGELAIRGSLFQHRSALLPKPVGFVRSLHGPEETQLQKIVPQRVLKRIAPFWPDMKVTCRAFRHPS